jgi:hypothetical protein
VVVVQVQLTALLLQQGQQTLVAEVVVQIIIRHLLALLALVVQVL